MNIFKKFFNWLKSFDDSFHPYYKVNISSYQDCKDLLEKGDLLDIVITNTMSKNVEKFSCVVVENYKGFENPKHPKENLFENVKLYRKDIDKFYYLNYGLLNKKHNKIKINRKVWKITKLVLNENKTFNFYDIV